MLGAVLSVVDKLLNYRPAGVGTFSKIGVLGKDYQSEKTGIRIVGLQSESKATVYPDNSRFPSVGSLT
jgi:hypothetical protein